TTVDGARAEGGPVSAGKTYVVGENGMELFTPGRSGVISPLDAYGSARGGAATGRDATVNVHLTAPITINGTSKPPKEAANEIVAHLNASLRSTLDGYFSDGTF